MDSVIENRLRWQSGIELKDFHLGGAAMMEASWMFSNVYVDIPGGSLHGPIKVTDCARKSHLARYLDLNRVIELQWEVWDELELPLDWQWVQVYEVVLFVERGGWFSRNCAEPRFLSTGKGWQWYKMQRME